MGSPDSQISFLADEPNDFDEVTRFIHTGKISVRHVTLNKEKFV